MKFKRIAAVTLTSALLGSFCTGAFADNNQTEIKLLVADKYDSDYVMTIPADFTITSDGFNALSGLKVAHKSGLETTFDPNSKVSVTAKSANTWQLKAEGITDGIGYTLTSEEGGDATTSWEFTSAEITNDGTTKHLGVDVESYENAEAGEYTDAITFTAEVESSAVAVTGIELNKTSTEIKVGSDETLTATVSPEDATDKTVTWESSEPTVATVDQNGKVTAVAVGTARITATANDGSGVKATCDVTVTTIDITPYIGKLTNAKEVNYGTWKNNYNTSITQEYAQALAQYIYDNTGIDAYVFYEYGSDEYLRSINRNGTIRGFYKSDTNYTILNSYYVSK